MFAAEVPWDPFITNMDESHALRLHCPEERASPAGNVLTTSGPRALSLLVAISLGVAPAHPSPPHAVISQSAALKVWICHILPCAP